MKILDLISFQSTPQHPQISRDEDVEVRRFKGYQYSNRHHGVIGLDPLEFTGAPDKPMQTITSIR
eukprot:gene31236-40601_t